VAFRFAPRYTPVMKGSRLISAAFCALALAACAGPQSRVKKHQAQFDSYPPEIQRKVLSGQVDVGFTEQQVSLALGKPDRVYVRKTAAGEQEVWAYGGEGLGPQISGGLGMTAGTGPGFYSAGIPIESEPDVDLRERMRIVLQKGVVIAVETRRK
jgi:hypothetical protein